MKGIMLVFGFSLFLLAFVSAGQLQVTNEHPFLIDGEWTDAQELNIGDDMTTIDGKRVRITGIEQVMSEDEFSVYNLEAGIYHDFVVCGEGDCVLDSEGIVVHNSDLVEDIVRTETSRYPFNGFLRKKKIRQDVYLRIIKAQDTKAVEDLAVHLVKRNPSKYLLSSSEMSNRLANFPKLVSGQSPKIPFSFREAMRLQTKASELGIKTCQVDISAGKSRAFIDFRAKVMVLGPNADSASYIHELKHLDTLDDWAVSRGFGRLTKSNYPDVVEAYSLKTGISTVYRDRVTGLLSYSKSPQSGQSFSMSKKAVDEYNSWATQFSYENFVSTGDNSYKRYKVSALVEGLRSTGYTEAGGGQLICIPH